jgi:hypothetical protein
MRKSMIVGLALLTSGCGFMSTVGAPPARILRSDGEHVVLFDPNGEISMKAAETAANKYCAANGKTAEFERQGGPALDCVSNQLHYCVTYACK